MTDAELQPILRELERLGWIYDPAEEVFRNGESQLKWDDALSLVPQLMPTDSPQKQ
jgi:hypothetical protein